MGFRKLDFVFIFILSQVWVPLHELFHLLPGLIFVDIVPSDPFQVPGHVIVLLQDNFAFIIDNIDGQVKVSENSHTEILHDILASTILLVRQSTATHLISKVFFAALVGCFVLLLRVDSAHDTGVPVELGRVEIVAFLVIRLQSVICEVREEVKCQLVLPLFDKRVKMGEVLVSAVLVVLDLLLALFVPLVGLDELGDILF